MAEREPVPAKKSRLTGTAADAGDSESIIEQQFTEFFRQNGLESTDELVTTLAIMEQAKKKLIKLKELFVGGLETSSANSVEKLLQSIDDTFNKASIITLTQITISDDNEEMFEELFEAREDFVQMAKEILDDSVTSVDDLKATYIRSLSPLTVHKSGRCFAFYFEFLNTFCKEKDLTGYGLDELKDLPYNDLVKKLPDIFGNYALFFAFKYKIRQGTAKAKGAEKLEPATISSYCFHLFVAFKIIGLLKLDLGRKIAFGEQMWVQTRANLRTLGRNKYLFKEKISAVDVVELLQKIKLENIAELQHSLFLLLVSEGGLRLSTLLAVDEKITDYKGLKLSDISFKLLHDQEFEVEIVVRREKQNKELVGRRIVHLTTKGRYTYICAASMLLLFVCTCKYTKQSMSEFFSTAKLEFKPECESFPLFSNVYDSKILTGDPLRKPTCIIKWLSSKTGIPVELLAVNSLRQGHGTSLYENAYMSNNEITENNAVNQVQSSGTWNSKACLSYFSHFIGPKLTTFRIYNTSIKEAIDCAVLENMACSVFLSDKFLMNKPSKEKMEKINLGQQEEIKKEIEKLRKNSKARETCLTIKALYEIDADKPMNFNGVSSKDRKAYKQAMTDAHNEELLLENSIRKDFDKKKELLKLEHWKSTKTTIKFDERFVPCRPDNIPHMDFQLLEQYFKDFKHASPFGNYSFERDVEKIWLEGIDCPFVSDLKNCKVVLRTKEQFSQHMKEHLALIDENTKKVLIYYCRHENCNLWSTDDKASFNSHISNKHPVLFNCSCGTHLSSESKSTHAFSNPTHESRFSWEFDPLFLPSKLNRCELCASVSTYMDKFDKCISKNQTIRDLLSAENLNSMHVVFKMMNPNITIREIAESILKDRFGMQDLPICLIPTLEKF